MKKTHSKQAGVNGMIDDVLSQLRGIVNGKKGALQKNDLWEAYTKLEYAILLLKLKNGFETAGGFEFTKFDKEREEELLEVAIGYLERGKKEFGGGSTGRVIDNLRKCRDALKLLVLKN